MAAAATRPRGDGDAPSLEPATPDDSTTLRPGEYEAIALILEHRREESLQILAKLNAGTRAEAVALGIGGKAVSELRSDGQGGALSHQEVQAARYLSRHSLEQKCSTCPSTVRVTLAPVET